MLKVKESDEIEADGGYRILLSGRIKEKMREFNQKKMFIYRFF